MSILNFGFGQALIQATFSGGNANDEISNTIYQDGFTYVLGGSNSSGFSSLNNFSANTHNTPIISKYDTLGNLLFSYQISNTPTLNFFSDFKIYKDTAYVVNLSITQNLYGADLNIYYTKYDLNTAQTIFKDSIYLQNINYAFPRIQLDSLANQVYITISGNDLSTSNFTTTNSLFNQINGSSSLYFHYDGNSNQLLLSTYLPQIQGNPVLYNDKLYFKSIRQPNDSSIYLFSLDALNDTLINEYFTPLDTIVFGSTFLESLVLSPQNTIVQKFREPHSGINMLMEFDEYLNIIDTLNIGKTSSFTSFYNIDFINNKLYATYDSTNALRFKIFDSNGNIVLNKRYPKLENVSVFPRGKYIYLTGESQNFATTNGSLGSSNSKALTFIKIDTVNYDICYSTYIGGVNAPIAYSPISNAYSLLNSKFINDKIHFVGATEHNKMPKTSGVFYGDKDFYYAIFDPELIFIPKTDTLNPKTQTVCKNGLAQTITSKKIEFIPTDSIPEIIFGSAAYEQILHNPIKYQWQEADFISGPFTDIAAAISLSYTPNVGVVNKFYRRVARLENCDQSYEILSDTVSVLVNNNFAPEVNAGGVFHTCPNENIMIGASPAVSNGTPPYQYLWSNGDTNSTTIVSPQQTGVYTLQVTDSNNCRQFDQAIVYAQQANAAKPDASCAGDIVTLNAQTIQGLTGVSYLWEGNNICCPNSAVNQVQVTSTENYILTLSIPKTGGGTCSTKDTVTVEYIAEPIANFAGSDRLVCLGTAVTVGIPEQQGFTYSWQPAEAVALPNHAAEPILTAFDNQNNTYFTHEMPSVNPLPVVATMQKRNCIFTDTAYIAYMEAVKEGARTYFCDTDSIGHPDRTLNISETYTWTKLFGNAQIVGATNNAQLAVYKPPNSGNSTFQLSATATVNGITNTCTENVELYENYRKNTSQASCFPIVYNGITYTSSTTIIEVIPSTTAACDTIHEHEIIIQDDCISFCSAIQNGIATVTVNNSLPSNIGYDFQWSVEIGTSNNVHFINVHKVEITDQVYRKLKLAISSASDSSILLEYEIDVYGGTWNPLIFNALDTSLCFPASSINIGESAQAATQYSWIGPGGFVSNLSNPLVAAPNIGENIYQVLISRNNCVLNETARVNLIQLENNLAGTDFEICENAALTLGNFPNPSNYHYAWQPSNAFWQNGTDEFSPNPEILIAVSTDFIVSYSDADSVCVAQDTVSIVVNNSPSLDIPDVDICKNEPTPIGLSGISGASFNWSPATGLSCINCAQPYVTLNSSESYTVDIVFSGNCVNPNYTDIVNVNLVEAVSAMQDISYCPDGSAVLLGADAPAAMNNYVWSPSFALSSANTANTAVNNPNGQSVESFVLSFIDQNACQVFDTLSIIPNINLPFVEAGQNRTICVNESTEIGQTTFDATAVYSWSPTTNITNSNAAFTSFSSQTPGTYVYVLTKNESSGNCVTTDTVTIQVSSPNIQDESYLICKNTCDSIGFLPENNTTYVWSPAAGLSNAHIAKPEVCNLTQNTNYAVSALDINGCQSVANVNVSVYNNIVPNISVTDSILFTNTLDSVSININPSGNYFYQWETSPYILNAQIKNAIFFFSTAGVYDFTLNLIDPTNGCIVSENVTIIVVDKVALENEISACDSIVFRSQTYFQSETIIDSLSIDTFVNNIITIYKSSITSLNFDFCDSAFVNGNWINRDTLFTDTLQTIYGCDSIVFNNYIAHFSSVEKYLDTAFCSNENFAYVFGDTIISGTGNYAYNFRTVYNCDSLVYLNVVEKSISSFKNIDTVVCLGENIALDFKTIFGETLQFSLQNRNTNSITLSENFNEELTIKQTNNCQQKISIVAFFKDCIASCKIMLPTGFSPNHDGVNDELVVFDDCKNGIEHFNIKLFNRWGELIFESDDMENSWKGVYKNEAVSLGVYTYIIKYQKVGSTEFETLSGNITLVN